MERLDFFENSGINGLEDLTLNEYVEFSGGESLWYWIAYGVSSGARAVGQAAKYVMEKNVEMIVEQGGYNMLTVPFK
ncbi:hypothetical protein [Porphyromonas levii]|uniref:hypothetical protein n=1 Tax=Porphyromonas levii TaxID=28114 RepID=UPI001070DFD7|nr:hypothetical protein [Porphyromonas levii]MBR8703339.1 hypothetical protein [Porphyromonas levii]MBR8730478.1 hypothetical protein [Porphyromonas levii]MBR8764134.1 hypothetical protein [Porphyromonas levii]MBR8766488.1 hypothetical protein [Porphyromonas levii]MBR8770399.1 hypothetical protein [Porphyromonas levii]